MVFKERMMEIQVFIRKACSEPKPIDKGPKSGQQHFWECPECKEYSYRLEPVIDHIYIEEWVSLEEFQQALTMRP
jgi:hypothetical protein